MRLAACFPCLLLVTPASAGHQLQPEASVGVYVSFEQAPREILPAALREEVRSILAPLGFHIEWRDMAAAGAEAWADLAVVTFQGHCDFDGTAFPAFVPGALGWTRVTDGHIQPFAEIDCDRIGSLVQNRLRALPFEDRERLFERAVARVVAHELYHVFVRTLVHGETGAGKAEFTASDLLSDRFPFRAEQARALRQSSARDLEELAGP